MGRVVGPRPVGLPCAAPRLAGPSRPEAREGPIEVQSKGHATGKPSNASPVSVDSGQWGAPGVAKRMTEKAFRMLGLGPTPTQLRGKGA